MKTTHSTWVTRYELPLFFILTYALTILATLGMNRFPDIHHSVFFVPQVFSPTLIAIILSGITGGWGAVKQLLLRYVQWRVRPFWYLAAFALAWIPLLLALIYIALGHRPEGPVPGMTPHLQPEARRHLGLLAPAVLRGFRRQGRHSVPGVPRPGDGPGHLHDLALQ